MQFVCMCVCVSTDTLNFIQYSSLQWHILTVCVHMIMAIN